MNRWYVEGESKATVSLSRNWEFDPVFFTILVSSTTQIEYPALANLGTNAPMERYLKRWSHWRWKQHSVKVKWWPQFNDKRTGIQLFPIGWHECPEFARRSRRDHLAIHKMHRIGKRSDDVGNALQFLSTVPMVSWIHGTLHQSICWWQIVIVIWSCCDE